MDNVSEAPDSAMETWTAWMALTRWIVYSTDRLAVGNRMEEVAISLERSTWEATLVSWLVEQESTLVRGAARVSWKTEDVTNTLTANTERTKPTAKLLRPFHSTLAD